jgi:hypothetical protein
MAQWSDKNVRAAKKPELRTGEMPVPLYHGGFTLSIPEARGLELFHRLVHDGK